MDDAVVTVIVPTIGRPSLTDALSSIVCQSYRHWLISVVVDGHQFEDATRRLLVNIDQARVLLTVIPHSGEPAVPRNKGLSMCQSELVAFLDDDDEWHPEKLEIQIRALTKRSVGVACNGTAQSAGGRSTYFANPPRTVTTWSLAHQNQIITSSILCRREALVNVGGFPRQPYLLEDYGAWLRLVSCGKIVFLNKNLVNYRIPSGDSISDMAAAQRAGRPRLKTDVFLVNCENLRWSFSRKKYKHFIIVFFRMSLDFFLNLLALSRSRVRKVMRL